MKFWTIQTKKVIQMVKNDGIYKPDFNKSYYIQNYPIEYQYQLKLLYNVVLESFNRNNNMNLSGLIFGFATSYDTPFGALRKICNPGGFEIDNFENFCNFMQMKKSVVEPIWITLKKRNVSIIELNYEESFNPIFIDINDWQFLMPPLYPISNYTYEDAERLLHDIENGIIEKSKFPSNIIQAHLPYIKAENILNIYPMFDLM